MNENLSRWIFISVAKHFESTASGLSLPYYVEGIHERTDDWSRADHVELRITGPAVKEVSKNYFSIEVVINFLFTQLMDASCADVYNLQRWVGAFHALMVDPVPIYKYGTGVVDDQSLIGCLPPKSKSADAVRAYYFGQADKDTRVRQAELDAVYETFLRF